MARDLRSSNVVDLEVRDAATGAELIPCELNGRDVYLTAAQIASLASAGGVVLRAGFDFIARDVTQTYEGNPVTYTVMFFDTEDFVPLAWAITGDANPRVCFVNDPSGGVLFLGDGTFEPYTSNRAAFLGWDGVHGTGTLKVGPNLNVTDTIFAQDISIAGLLNLTNLNALPFHVGLLDPGIRDSFFPLANAPNHLHRVSSDPNTIPSSDAVFTLVLAGPSTGTVRIVVTGGIQCDDIDAATISTANIQAAFDSGIAPGAFTVVQDSTDHWTITAIAPPYTESLRLATFADNCTPPATLTQLIDGRALGFPGDLGDICLTPVGTYEKTGGADTGWTRLFPVPSGGTTGQVLAKASNADYDLVWT